jgi:hypothetical protein
MQGFLTRFPRKFHRAGDNEKSLHCLNFINEFKYLIAQLGIRKAASPHFGADLPTS